MIDENLSFDPMEHAYMDGSTRRPSVTEVLQAIGYYKDYRFLGTVDQVRVRARGRSVHKGARWADSGEYDEALTDPEIRPYVARYLEFKADMRFRGLLWEVGFINEEYAGTIDVFGIFEPDNTPAIVDLKSGSLPRMVGAQLAGYEHLLYSGRVIKNPDLEKSDLERIVYVIQQVRSGKRKVLRRSLQLTKEKYYLRPCDEPEWPAIWRSGLNTFNARRKYGQL